MTEREEYILLEDTIRQNYASVVWSHKIQEKQSDIYAKRFEVMEIIKILISSITTAGIISTIFSDKLVIKILTAIFSVISLFINGYFKSFNLQNLVASHKSTANKLLNIREKLLLLLTKIKFENESVSVLSEKYEEIMNALNQIYLDAPTTTNKAVKKASEALNMQRDNTYTSEEIDNFLPQSLRKGN